MRRNAPLLLAAIAALCVSTGCSTTTKTDNDMMSTSDTYASEGAEQGYTQADDPVYGDPYANSYSSPTTSDPYGGGSGQTHTVAKHDTLYSLARAYYNDQRRWRDIYEANRDTLTDPNKIFVGQRLVIP